jgi:succinate dehydrogenase / fumarate reductase membrane anchor subunit
MRRPDSYAAWKALFAGGFARIATLIFFAALAWHAWIGMRDILIDYVHAYGLRLVLQAAITLVLAGYLVWAAALLWGLQP